MSESYKILLKPYITVLMSYAEEGFDALLFIEVTYYHAILW